MKPKVLDVVILYGKCTPVNASIIYRGHDLLRFKSMEEGRSEMGRLSHSLHWYQIKCDSKSVPHPTNAFYLPVWQCSFVPFTPWCHISKIFRIPLAYHQTHWIHIPTTRFLHVLQCCTGGGYKIIFCLLFILVKYPTLVYTKKSSPNDDITR